MDETTCQTLREQVTSYMQQESNNLHKIEKFVVATIFFFAVVFLLGGLKKRYAKIWLKLISSSCYMAVPILISYTLGLMGKPGNSQGSQSMFSGVYGIWAVFLLFAYASFDNLTAFNLQEIHGRSKLLFQFLSQLLLLLLLLYNLPSHSRLLSIALVFFVVFLKVVERLVALAYASGSTPGIKENLRKIMNFVNKDHCQDEAEAEDEAGDGADSRSMHGVKYLVGPKYTTTKNGEIVEGITLEKVWGCNGRLLSSEPGGGDLDGQLKDICLSFSLFWLLLGKIRGYTSVYTTRSSRMKAWKLVLEGLLKDEDRTFRVIEVELSFLQDYFYSKYMIFYLNGFYIKLISVIGFPIMYWYFSLKAYDYQGFNTAYKNNIGVDPNLNPKAFEILISVLYVLEIIQLLLYVTSEWYNVTLICFYAKKRSRFLQQSFGGVIGAACRVSRYTRALFCKTWKRRLNQYCLIKSCTSVGVESKYLEAICSIFGTSLSNPGIKQSRSVPLSKDLKRAVILSLQTNGPKLSNGKACLKRSGVEEKLSWALNLQSNSETILVWHIATSICEMKYEQEDYKPEGYEVATRLSKYCAYLLAFAPMLVSIPVFEAEVVCETTVKEARDLLKTPFSCCGKVEGDSKYERLMKLTSEKEVGEGRSTTLRNGVRLGIDIGSIAGDEIRWKILAEFWAEFILFLAPSDNNEMAHAEKLAEGGEFITHLWALLIHAGILD